MDFGFSFSTLLGSIAIVAALVWFVGAVIRRIVGHRLEGHKRVDF